MDANTKRITKDQKTYLIQYLEEHREFAHERFVNDSGVKTIAEQWSALAIVSNSIGGAVKDGDGWKRAWVNMRSKTKQKSQDLKNSLERSGVNGGPQKDLSELDKRIIGLMTKEAIVGQMEVGEPLRAAGVVPDNSFLETGDIQVT